MATLDQVRARLGQTDLPYSQAGLRDMALLSVLRPAADPATGLSARQSTLEAARYRAALDRVLADQKTLPAAGQARLSTRELAALLGGGAPVEGA